MQVVGPSVRAFGLCVDGTSTGICEPLSPAMDMLLIPHLPDSFASLATMFSSIPRLVSLTEAPLTDVCGFVARSSLICGPPYEGLDSTDTYRLIVVMAGDVQAAGHNLPSKLCVRCA